jgi:hypothetical protein
MNIIKINIDGTMNEIKIKKTVKILSFIKKNICNSGSGNIKELYKWIYEDKIIKCYGWINGVCGFENSHDLLQYGISTFLYENSEEIILYGDIFLVCYENDKIVNFNISDYGLFYNITNDEISDNESIISQDIDIISISSEEDENYVLTNYSILEKDASIY